MCFRWNTSINFLFWGFETTPSWSHFKVLLCKLIWDGYTHRFLLPLFLLFFLTLFDLWSRFVFLNSASPSLSSSVGYLFCLMMLSISGLYAGISCRRLQGLLSHLLCRSQSFQKCWTVHTIVDDDEKFRNVYISNLSFPKKKLSKFSHLLSSAGGHYIIVSCCLLKVLQPFYLDLKTLLLLHVYLSSFRRLEVLSDVVLIRPPSSKQWQLTAIPLLSPWSTFTNCSVYASLTLAHS